MIPAIVLAAGLGTRLQPLSGALAKPAMPVAGSTLIERILEQLRQAGVTDAVVNLHHLGHTITSVVGDGSHLGLRVRYSWERQILGSGGGPARALRLIDGDRMLILNGDTLTDFDLSGLVRTHERSGALVTLAVVPNTDPQKYGGVAADADGVFTGLVPKGSTTPSWHFVGVQVAERSAYDGVSPDEPSDSISGVYRELASRQPGSVRIAPITTTFDDIGTPADYLRTSVRLAGSDVPLLHGPGVVVESGATVESSVLWSDVHVAAGARLSNCIVMSGTRVPAGSWEGVVLTTDVAPRVQQFLTQMGLSAGVRVTPLTPDASDRRYFRAEADGIAPIVLAVHPGPIVFNDMPFSDAHALLSAMPVPVPAVLGHDDALGIIALGDLGNVTLQAHLAGVDEEERRQRYEEAIAHIVTLQRRGRELASTNRLPYRLAFDVEKLMFELRFFREHFLEGWRQAQLTADDQHALEREFLAIATELAAEPRVVCHRDYHSRNLMVLRSELFLIDYQDARMGPDTYDLASLLRDSYVDLPERLADGLIDVFLCATRPDPAAARAEFVRRFDLMSVQRNIKALGTFGFQARKGNHGYVADMPRTLGYVRANLAKYPRFGALRRTLARHVPELA